MSVAQQIYAIIKNLNFRISSLEAESTEWGPEHTRIHTRRERTRDGAAKVHQYMKEFQQFHERHSADLPREFPRSLHLELSNEDSRYTTDVSPGMYSKEMVFSLYDTWRKHHKRSSSTQDISVWDLYCSPGMDILYLMLTDHLLKRRDAMHPHLKIVGVSKADTPSLEGRFERMESNVRALTQLVPGTPSPTLFRSTALNFCQKYHGKTPDIVFLNPPWMKTMGEMEDEEREVVRPHQEIITDTKELITTIYSNTGSHPKMVVISVPYPWEQFDSILESMNEGKSTGGMYTLIHSIDIMKKSSADQSFTISGYFNYVIMESNEGERPMKPNFSDFTYYV